MTRTDEVIARTAPGHLIDHNLIDREVESLCDGMVRYEKRPAKRRDGSVAEGLFNAWIIFNNPKQYNSYTTDMVKATILAFRRASVDREVNTVVFTGVGDKAFCTGGNTKEYAEYYAARLWHIPYQAQYVLWKDGAKRKSVEWLHVVAELMEICAIRSLVDCPDTIKAMIESKRDRLEKVITYCQVNEFNHCVSYLENARGDMFTALENRLEGKTTSRVERLFRTVNMRVNVSKWSTEGALNVTKVRLAYYYNGFDA